METSDFNSLTLKQKLLDKEAGTLSPFAAKSPDMIRRYPDQRLDSGYRLPCSVDTDRILNSHAYTRYIDKTQVFSLIKNDHITHRVLHVQLVSKIARTIGHALDLNENLIEAISLGHDIGHTPFGHDGEKILSRLCLSHGIGEFHHNVQSVRFLNSVERNGRGWNLCLQTLDGILCHNGEVHDTVLIPQRKKTFSTLDSHMDKITAGNVPDLTPMTLEGCTARVADTISYIGRDIEDAIRLNIIDRSSLPEDCVRILGNTNGTIVHNLVTDVIKNSTGQDRISYSPEVADALKTLKEFNLERIYLNPESKKHLVNIDTLFRLMFERYMDDLETGNTDSVIIKRYLNMMPESYYTGHKHAEIVRDFISGMTDMYFLDQCPDNLKPRQVIR